MCRLTELYNFDRCGLRIIIPDGVFDALGGTPNCGPDHARTVDHHRGGLDTDVREIGEFVDRDQKDTQEEEVGSNSHGSEQERKVRTTLQLLLN